RARTSKFAIRCAASASAHAPDVMPPAIRATAVLRAAAFLLGVLRLVIRVALVRFQDRVAPARGRHERLRGDDRVRPRNCSAAWRARSLAGAGASRSLLRTFRNFSLLTARSARR